MGLCLVNIHGDIEGDYEIVGNGTYIAKCVIDDMISEIQDLYYDYLYSVHNEITNEKAIAISEVLKIINKYLDKSEE